MAATCPSKTEQGTQSNATVSNARDSRQQKHRYNAHSSLFVMMQAVHNMPHLPYKLWVG